MSKVISELLWFCITSLSDWLKVLAPFCQPIRSESKPIVARACTFSRALCRLRVITSSFDWFTGLSPSFLIGQSKYFGLGLRHSIETRSISLSTNYGHNPVFGYLSRSCLGFFISFLRKRNGMEVAPTPTVKIR